MEALKKMNKFDRKGPLVLVIMDGVGYGKSEKGDAVLSTHTPTLNWFHENCPHRSLKAHGKAVGLPSDKDMGNSEVGHNAIGCGRVFAQGAKLVEEAVNSGNMFKGDVWNSLVENCLQNNSTLHFLGLFSDANVHSNIKHLKKMLLKAKKMGVKKARIHVLLDGRDVGETSALEYINPFEDFLSDLNADSVDYRIASGGGRMQITMDRYGADWSMITRGWNLHVKGEGRQFSSAREAIETLREETEAIDQDLPSFVIAENAEPIGKIEENDSVVNFNFRGDRAMEISRAFDDENIEEFDRGPKLNVKYAGMMEYDGDAKIPKNYLVDPPSIDRTVGEFLCASGCRTLAISETQKYGHVTYFYNGNKSGKINAELEDYIEIPSDIIPFEERPWMKSAEITDAVTEAIISEKYDFIRLNFPNGDMVGHTGIYQATEIAVAAVDLALSRIKKVIDKVGGIMLISADHGNADDMYTMNKKTGEPLIENGKIKAKTSHSLNPVPCIVYDPSGTKDYSLSENENLGISSLAATCMNLLDYEAPADYDESVINL
ncbi:MAG: 2,3-bisphosphoglycerate-independent phosphoglycerate mutase [Verrucomicrobiota bacterium]|nr:2,3-bisphosphoglycerate-independent phosphoglycerate mutase [Verrucomicrobiota bacterium]